METLINWIPRRVSDKIYFSFPACRSVVVVGISYSVVRASPVGLWVVRQAPTHHLPLHMAAGFSPLVALSTLAMTLRQGTNTCPVSTLVIAYMASLRKLFCCL